ncbi:MAG: DUF433 domain-containing protein [Vulcanimicrobiota bacterium]
MDLMLSEYITSTPGICGGKPCIKGHRIRVQDVAALTEYQQQTPVQIAREFHLSLAEVHAALVYYYEHLDEIRGQMRQERERFLKLKAESSSKLRSA